MIVRVWCESGAGWAPTHVPVTPDTTCRDVLDCCREPGDEPCLLFSVHPHHGGTAHVVTFALRYDNDVSNLVSQRAGKLQFRCSRNDTILKLAYALATVILHVWL